MKNTCCVTGEVETRDSDKELARLADALGNPARVAIVRVLKRRGVCICGEIVEELPLAQSTVSQHLKVLKNAGWVVARNAGACTCYELNPQAIAQFQALWDAL